MSLHFTSRTTNNEKEHGYPQFDTDLFSVFIRVNLCPFSQEII